MINILKKTDCCGCGACTQTCPKKCISMCADGEGFLYPRIDLESCIHCGACDRVCPMNGITETTKLEEPLACVAYAKDENMRVDSSSGGIFTILAKRVLEQGGVVFGAAFDDDFSVHHIKVDNEADLYKLRGSKYLQSRIEDCFWDVRTELESGRKVLFTGVSCQISGLKKFLGKEYSNLLTADMLCHGTPSPKLWQIYINHVTKTEINEAKSVYFRDKSEGWRKYSLRIDSESECYRQTLGKDPFFRMFLSDICLRPSCHCCKFKGFTRVSDITLGDAWGIEKVMPEMDDDKGTSVVVIHTEKGKALWQEIESEMVQKPGDINELMRGNPSFWKSVKKHPNREKFFVAMNSGASVEKLVSLVRKPLPRRALSFAKRCAKKLLVILKLR